MRLLFAACILLLSYLPVSAVSCFYHYRAFCDPTNGPYIELYLNFPAQGLKLQPISNGQFQAHAEVQIALMKEDTVVVFKKFVVLGPECAFDKPSDVLAIERLPLANGVYNLELEVRDMASDQPASVLKDIVTVDIPSTGLCASDIELVRAYSKTEAENPFSKSGVDLLPFVAPSYSSDIDEIIYYVEFYRTDSTFGADQPFVVSSFIENQSGTELPNTRRIKRMQSAPVVPFLSNTNLRDVATGDYRLVVEIRNRENAVVYSRKEPFIRTAVSRTRTNEISDDILERSFVAAYNNPDTLYLFCLSLQPIAASNDRNTIRSLSKTDLRTMKSFFYNFWWQKNQDDPLAAWSSYHARVVEAESAFAMPHKHCWDTDRGRVYLLYGPPNTRVMRPSLPNYWPFEIWHYYETDNKLRNVKFLFYSTTLNGDYDLLHSDAPAETKNYDWKNLVRNRTLNDPATVNRIGNNQFSDPYSRDEVEDLWYNPH
jgi:GWxTD domain-containing protein